MTDNKLKRKALVLSVAMAVSLLLPLPMNAQYDENKYGIQPWFGSSLLGRESGRGGGYNLINEQFGSDINGGYELHNQTFGQELPLGSGLLILTAAGAGYALKKRKSNKKH